MSKIEQFKLSPVGTTGRKFLASRPRFFFHDGKNLTESASPKAVVAEMVNFIVSGSHKPVRGIVVAGK